MEMAKIGLKNMEMSENIRKWLKMAGMTGNS